MPERKVLRGKLVKNARRLSSGKIRVTFASPYGVRGPQLDIPLEDYEKEVIRSFKPSNN